MTERSARRFGRLWRRRSSAVAPADAYRRWAESYGDEPNALQALEADAIEAVLPDPSGLRVLDLGCGRGRLAATLRQRGAAVAVAADLTLAMLVHPRAPRATGLHRVCSATHPLPFPAARFDLVVCALVLGHVDDLDAALEAASTALAAGGHLVISDFHPYATLRGWERTFADDDGRDRPIEQHLHLFEDYVRAFTRLGLVLEDLREPRWDGQPVAFALRARKTERFAAPGV